MMKINDFKKVGSILISGLIVGACSPVAPSVNKISNAQSSKSNTTDPNSGAINASAPSGLIVKGSTSLNADPVQRTEVVSRTKYTGKGWDKIQAAHPTFEMDIRAFHNILSDLTKGTSFSVEVDKVKRREDELMRTNVRILLIVNAEQTLINEFNAAVKASLTWDPGSSKVDPHWELKITEPSKVTGDPGSDTAAEKLLDKLRGRLEGIAVEFQSDLQPL